jgi:hypothetical protein
MAVHNQSGRRNMKPNKELQAALDSQYRAEAFLSECDESCIQEAQERWDRACREVAPLWREHLLAEKAEEIRLRNKERR